MQSPMSLAEVCEYLDTGQASLYRVCQEHFGMGIIEMMMQVRLEESRRALIMNKHLADSMEAQFAMWLCGMDLSIRDGMQGDTSPVLVSCQVRHLSIPSGMNDESRPICFSACC